MPKKRTPRRRAERRTEVYQVRLTPTEHATLHATAKAAKKTVAAFVRQRIL